jgi:two-component system response regulator YesN
VRGRISSRISEETGFAVVGTAGNGDDALDLIESESPHVVLTDIKMPYMDGIELASVIRRDYPTVRVAFITGYNEFDYAREAIKLRAAGYLTKPLTEETIRDFLTQLKQELDDELESFYGRREIERQYEESIPHLVEHGFSSLLISSGPSDSLQEADQLQGYGVDLGSKRYVTIYTTIERSPESRDVISFEKLKISVRGTMEKALGQEDLVVHSFLFDAGIVLVVEEDGVLFERELDLALNQIIRTTEHFLAVKIHMGVSDPHRGFAELRRSYEEATRALESGRLTSLGQLIYFSEIRKAERDYTVLAEADAERLYRTLQYEDSERVVAVLEEIRDSVNAGSGAMHDHRLVMIGVTAVLIRYAALVNADLTELNGGDVMESVARMMGLDEFIAWAGELAGALKVYGERSRMDNAERLLNQAIAYMEEHYSEKGLTMQVVADEQGPSVSYLGQLFKRYKNTTFVKYLTGLRMEKAKEKLLLSGSRIVEVADECGYKDVYYFSHCFRKHVGVPPKKYREDHA